jgi:hypothetical protein
MEREARCCCGNVAVVVEGEPAMVVACHCDYCQRRTGSVFQVSCWYPNDRVKELRGETQVFRETPANPGVSYHFCPKCGSTVHWSFDFAPEHRGIAVGCFADEKFPAPSVEMFTTYRHDWVAQLDGASSFEGFPTTDVLPIED